ncbi:MAG: bifunctional glutamate N-acetyltransferase/amino-acid acetyltransferase ArgJ [Acidaminococcales bacterium]|jgi:glutamate N-acetyltransferase/amino-acid N-acetyltransferase|nr:bifunctional glutamate N-acetyltransferase/amino-acid acetyltransferase ArgJ [Acidaminococcales bacterium]
MKAIDGWITAPGGFTAAGVKAGIKASGKEDVALIVSENLASCGAVFTQNIMAAAPVLFSRRVAAGGYARAIAVNAGCANASTGERGLNEARAMAGLTAELLSCGQQEVFVCSTGVIGPFLPMDKIVRGLKDAYRELSVAGGGKAAAAIQTTDTFIKRAAYEFTLEGRTAVIAGIAKGAGMIHPDMATMLAFITTDAAVSPAVLSRAVKKAADLSFNMVVVDGDTSTNDSLIALANGFCGNSLIDSENHPGYASFFAALTAVSVDLAKLIARDGEGATKFLEVTVDGAPDFAAAKAVAMAVAKSPLVKTAFFGCDPNWGRIICAVGYAGVNFAPEDLTVALNGVEVFARGGGVAADAEKLGAIMKERDIILKLALGAGQTSATVWTCDLSYDYIKINADYHT